MSNIESYFFCPLKSSRNNFSLKIVELVCQKLAWLVVDRLSHQEGQLMGILAGSRHSHSTLQNNTNYCTMTMHPLRTPHP